MPYEPFFIIIRVLPSTKEQVILLRKEVHRDQVTFQRSQTIKYVELGLELTSVHAINDKKFYMYT